MSASRSDTSFPTSTSDIIFSNAQAGITSSIYQTLRTLRKSTLSIPRRLQSILQDSLFIESYFTRHAAYAAYPLIANERCGSWYIPPHLKGGSAYFKSTDGHHGQWALSLRRLNLQILHVLGDQGGAVLIDSTRRGKRLPDALRRTVPIWVAVWNRLLFSGTACDDSTDTGCEMRRLICAFQSCGLDPAEVRQVEARLDGFVDGVRDLGLDLDGLRSRLKRPIRCVWVVHGEKEEILSDQWTDASPCEHCNVEQEWTTLVLCSASRRVDGAEMSEDGYIQGAGDDSEGWSGGLTPSIFWKHKDILLNTNDEDILELIQQLVKTGVQLEPVEAIHIVPTPNLFVAAGHDLTDVREVSNYDLIINCNGSHVTESLRCITLSCRTGKLGSRDLREKLATVRMATLTALKKNPRCKILVQCDSGKDLSIGVIVILLCSFYDEDGCLDLERSKRVVDKQVIKQRLAWVTSCKPDANPSRSTLQAVNSFLIDRPP